jgi:hypothetical protein
MKLRGSATAPMRMVVTSSPPTCLAPGASRVPIIAWSFPCGLAPFMLGCSWVVDYSTVMCTHRLCRSCRKS